MSDTSQDHKRVAAIPRSRGAVTGLLLVALGIWGAVIPFVGPYFHYAYTPSDSLHFTSARFFLEVLPGAAVFLGGLMLLSAGNRFSASAGGYLAAAGGAWFVVGPLLAPIYRVGYLGHPASSNVTHVALEQIGFFYGLGAAIVLLSAFALGRVSVVSVRDLAVAEKRHDKKHRDDQTTTDTTAGTEQAAQPAGRNATTIPATTRTSGSAAPLLGTTDHVVQLPETGPAATNTGDGATSRKAR